MSKIASKELSPEELRRRLEWLRDLSDDDDTAIEDHIAALTARAERAEARAERERNIGLELALDELRTAWSRAPTTPEAIRLNELGDQIRRYLSPESAEAQSPHPGDAYRAKVRAEALEEAARVVDLALFVGTADRRRLTDLIRSKARETGAPTVVKP